MDLPQQRRRGSFVLAVAVTASLWGVTPATGQIAFDRGAFAERVDSLAQAFLVEGPVAGAAIAVQKDGELILAEGYGLAEIEHNVPMTVEGVFRIGSISKQFAAVAILQLVEQGKVRLDDPITRFLPEYPTQGHDVTVHHLLTHTSGIVSYTGMGPAFWDKSRLDLTHDEMVELFGTQPFEFAPGERWNYNNSGYYLLGMIVEEVARTPTVSEDPDGEEGGPSVGPEAMESAYLGPEAQSNEAPTYADYLDEHIFAPLGMTGSSYCDETAIVPNRAEGYEVQDGSLVNDQPLSMNLPGAAGALCSNVLDLLRWQNALDTNTLIGADSRALMLTEATLNDGSGTGYGYGLGISEFEGHRKVSHGGGINGFSTQLATYPDDGLVIAVLTNTGNSGPGALEGQIARLALGLPLAVTLDLALDGVDVSRYVGTYSFEDAGVQVVIQAREGALWMSIEGQGEIRLRYQGGDEFIVQAGQRLVFKPDADPPGAELDAGGTSLVGVKQPQ
jgi:D-alanyl-D-alanine carboxypeptidase